MVAALILATQIPVTGMAPPELMPFEKEMLMFMQKHNIPGGSLAVSKDGRLVFAKGFGYLDTATKETVKPDSLFRLASVSKPITGLAVERLIDEGKLTYEHKPFDLLGYKAGDVADSRLSKITIRHLLNHSGGWDREKSGDPMFKNHQIVRELKISYPVTSNDVIRWMTKQRLDFEPGTSFAYSNFGYCVLGRIIEKASGKSYEDYVKSAVLTPAGITTMHIGANTRSRRAKNETLYFGEGQVTSIFDGVSKIAPPYVLDPTLMDAHGGWVASAVDLMKLSRLLDNTSYLGEATKKRILTAPPAPLARNANGTIAPAFYTSGWNVRPQSEGANYWHNGGMAGTSTLYARLANGNSWAVLFNSRLEADGRSEVDQMLHRAAGSVRTWPKLNYFSAFGILE